VVVRWTDDDTGAADAVPARFDVGSRVHEYGGGAYLPAGRTLFACNQGDQRLYRIEGQRDPVLITPAPPTPASQRYADLRLVSSGALLVCVRERHQGGEVVNELVALPTDGSAEPWVVASGHDFYAAPRPSPDGRRLAWLTWDRPCMPWDGADLWVADLGPDARLGPASHVVGGPHESVVQPEWSAEGVLHFVSDRTGWWTCIANATARSSRCWRWRPSSPTPRESSTTPATRSSLTAASPVATGSRAATTSASSTPKLVGSRTCRFRTPRSSPIFG
jgi:hypothetical protein